MFALRSQLENIDFVLLLLVLCDLSRVAPKRDLTAVLLSGLLYDKFGTCFGLCTDAEMGTQKHSNLDPKMEFKGKQDGQGTNRITIFIIQ